MKQKENKKREWKIREFSPAVMGVSFGTVGSSDYGDRGTPYADHCPYDDYWASPKEDNSDHQGTPY